MYVHSGSGSTLVQPAMNDIDVSDLTGEHLQVPPNSFSPCLILTTELSAIDVQQACNDNGKMLYVNTVQVIGQHLSRGCSTCSV